VEKAEDDAQIKMFMEGENFSGDMIQRTVAIPLGKAGASGEERLLSATGMTMRLDDDGTYVDNVDFNTPAQRWGIDFDWRVLELNKATVRIAKEWFYIPAYGLLFLIAFWQITRRRKQQELQNV